MMNPVVGVLMICLGVTLILWGGKVVEDFFKPNGGSGTVILRYTDGSGTAITGEIPSIEIIRDGAGGDQNPGSRTQPPQEVWYRKEKP